MHSEEAVVAPQYPAVTILVHPDREDPAALFSLVTHGLPDQARHQKFELMLKTCLPHLSADCSTLEGLAQTIICTGWPIDHESGAVRNGVRQPLIGVLAHDPRNEVVVELVRYEDTGNDHVMSHDSRRWEEFRARLEGPEGIDCPLEKFVSPFSRLPATKRRLLIRLADEVLLRMGMKSARSWTLLERYDGECSTPIGTRAV